MQPFVGEIKILPWDWAPKHWALCNGALLPIAQNQALFSLLGIQYGGNGVTTFALPDLRGRTAVHTADSSLQGSSGGAETVRLISVELPQHTHLFQGVTDNADKKLPGGNLIGTDTSTGTDFLAPPGPITLLNPAVVGQAGGSAAHENRQPFLALNYCIALQGVFPSRN